MNNDLTYTCIALGIEYEGTHYHGWQSQNELNTVQLAVEKALSKIANIPIKVVCAGRTDTGVHALNQVVHFKLPTLNRRDLRAWVFGANNYLPKDIRVTWAKEVTSDFHARFSANARHYRYLIYNHPTASTILHQRTFWFPRPLNLALMQQGADYLIGKHDFSAFRSSECQARSAIRTVETIKIRYQETMFNRNLISIDLKANAFLHHMVRNIVGTLLSVGLGKHPAAWVKEVLESCYRTQGGITAPASVLYFLTAAYPSIYDLPYQLPTSK